MQNFCARLFMRIVIAAMFVLSCSSSVFSFGIMKTAPRFRIQRFHALICGDFAGKLTAKNTRPRYYTRKVNQVRNSEYAKKLRMLTSDENFVDNSITSESNTDHATNAFSSILALDHTLFPASMPSNTTNSIESWIKRITIYEDKDIVVVYKPPTVLSQPEQITLKTKSSKNLKSESPKKPSKAMPDLSKLLFRPDPQFESNDDSASEIDQSRRLYVVHRLDRPSSGVMVYAKHQKAAASLSRSFQDRLVDKGYVVVVNGKVDKSAELNHQIMKTNAERTKVMNMPTDTETKGNSEKAAKSNTKPGKFVTASLHYDSLEVFEVPKYNSTPGSTDAESNATPTYQSLLKVHLETGRKHQIRAQLGHIGHPVCGDQKYGAPQMFKARDIALHAYYLRIPHPTTGKMLTFACGPPSVWGKRFGVSALQKVEAMVDAKTYKGKRPVAAASDSGSSPAGGKAGQSPLVEPAVRVGDIPLTTKTSSVGGRIVRSVRTTSSNRDASDEDVQVSSEVSRQIPEGVRGNSDSLSPGRRTGLSRRQAPIRRKGDE